MHIFPRRAYHVSTAREYLDAANKRVAELTEARRVAQESTPDTDAGLFARLTTLISLKSAIAVARAEAEHWAREVERLSGVAA